MQTKSCRITSKAMVINEAVVKFPPLGLGYNVKTDCCVVTFAAGRVFYSAAEWPNVVSLATNRHDAILLLCQDDRIISAEQLRQAIGSLKHD